MSYFSRCQPLFVKRLSEIDGGLPAEVHRLVEADTHDEQQFFKELGTRIAQLRKEAGLSQQAVADSLEIAQQTYANYEVARARPAVSMLPTLAQLFGISVDELLGLKNGAGKRGPMPLLQKQIERLNRLPRAQQKVVMQMLDGVLSQASR
jgi:transcriptional regulator with XRE-family HTH domain